MVWVILFLCILINLIILCILAKKWKKIHKFFHEEGYTYFEIFFSALYFLEQAIFITLSYFYPEHNKLFVGFFALVVLTTVALNKIMMESRNRRLSGYVNESLTKFRLTRENYEEELEKQSIYVKSLEEDNKFLIGYIKKKLKK